MTKIRDELIDLVMAKSTVPLTIQEKPYTAIEMIFEHSHEVFVAKGFSKVKWPDKWDDEFGFDLACLKAASKIVKEIMRQKILVNILLKEIQDGYTTTG